MLSDKDRRFALAARRQNEDHIENKNVNIKKRDKFQFTVFQVNIK